MSSEIKSIEVYGFVGWVSSFAVFALYVLWMVMPAEMFLSLGLP